jgi:polyisoprenoid-binding protein YceI
MRTLLVILVNLCLLPAAHAAWQLDAGRSTLSFATIKADNIGEVHRFDKLSGSVDNAGKASVVIDLASVNTALEVRDQRLRDILFEVASFPTASLQAQVDAAQVDGLAVGASAVLPAEATLNLHGQAAPVTLELRVTRLAADRVQVIANRQVVVSAAQFNLVDGVEKLREIAGLPRISQAVPVSFVLEFTRAQ